MTDHSASPRIVPWPDGRRAREAVIEQAANVLAAGGLVVFPTDTVYGIGAHRALPQAVGRLFQVKRRPPTKQIALLLDDPAVIETLASRVPPQVGVLARQYWPGPLTLVMTARDGGTIAFRQPDHEVPRAIIRAVGSPLATTSANLSGRPSPHTAADVLAQLPSGYELLIDGGRSPGGADSTVLDFTGPTARLLRAGPIDRRELERIIGPVDEE